MTENRSVIMQETIFAVEWDGGKITGFSSKREAERYIESVCKKVAGNHKYPYIVITASQQQSPNECYSKTPGIHLIHSLSITPMLKRENILIEALPYIREFHNSIMVIKMGGMPS